jgi:competence protein ComGF
MTIVAIAGLALVAYAMYLISEHLKRRQQKDKLNETFIRNDDRNDSNPPPGVRD